MIIKVKRKPNILGVIWGIYTQTEYLRVGILHDDQPNDSPQYYC